MGRVSYDRRVHYLNIYLVYLRWAAFDGDVLGDVLAEYLVRKNDEIDLDVRMGFCEFRTQFAHDDHVGVIDRCNGHGSGMRS